MTDTPTFLTRDAIREAHDQVTEVVDVPEWGGQVRVRALSGAEVERIYQQVNVTEGRGKKQRQVVKMEGWRARIVVMGVVDANDQPLFKSSDAAWLSEKSAAALSRVALVIQRLSGMSDDEEEADEAGEDSAATSGAASPSA